MAKIKGRIIDSSTRAWIADVISNYEGGVYATYTYVDGSLALRDASIAWLDTNKLGIDSSLSDLSDVSTDQPATNQVLGWNGTIWIPVDSSSVGGGTSYAYVDGSLAARDASITYLFNWNIDQDGSITALFNENDVQNIELIRLDGSIGVLFTEDLRLDASIADLYNTKLGTDASLSDLSDVDTTGVGGAQDGSALVYDSGTETWVAGVAGGGGGLTDVSMGGISDTSLGTVTDGDLIQYTGATYDNVTPVDISTLTLDASDYFIQGVGNLVEVSTGGIGAPQDGSALVYNSDGYWEYGVAGGGGGSDTFAGLTDTSVGTQANNDGLLYNSTTSTWDNVATIDISSLYYSQDYLDSSISQLALEDIRQDGSITYLFENAGEKAFRDLSDVSISTAEVGDLTQMVDGSTWENITPVDVSSLTVDISSLVVDASEYFVQKSDLGYGQMYINSGTYDQSIPSGSTLAVMTGWTADVSKNVNMDASEGYFWPTAGGLYKVAGSFSVTSNTNNVTLTGSFFRNETHITPISFQRKIGTGSDVGAMGFAGIITMDADASISMRMKHDSGGAVTVRIVEGNINVHRIGES